jgi:hypothetical protein
MGVGRSRGALSASVTAGGVGAADDRTNGNRDPKSSVLPFDNDNYVQVTLNGRHGSRLEVAVGSWRTIS